MRFGSAAAILVFRGFQRPSFAAHACSIANDRREPETALPRIFRGNPSADGRTSNEMLGRPASRNKFLKQFLTLKVTGDAAPLRQGILEQVARRGSIGTSRAVMC